MNKGYDHLKRISGAEDKVRPTGHLKFFFFLGVILTIIYIVFSGHKKQQETEAEVYNRTLQIASSKLQENLAKLKALDREVEHQPKDNTIKLATEKKKYSKSYLARLAAPSSVFNMNQPASGKSKIYQGRDKLEETGLNHMLQGSHDVAIVTAKKLSHTDQTIPAGDFLQATLNVASNSDLPGLVSAIITSPVYSLTGENCLIPAGSQLFGEYSSSVLQGQSRIFIIWNRVMLPDGIYISINSPGTDSLGQAGSAANDINRHFFQRFGHATLLSLLGAGVANYNVSSGDQYNSSAEYRTAIANSLQESANESLKGDVAIKPTLKIYQGSKVNVFVAHDLYFPKNLYDENL